MQMPACVNYFTTVLKCLVFLVYFGILLNLKERFLRKMKANFYANIKHFNKVIAKTNCQNRGGLLLMREGSVS